MEGWEMIRCGRWIRQTEGGFWRCYEVAGMGHGPYSTREAAIAALSPGSGGNHGENQ